MSRLRQLNDLIVGVDSEAKAIALVKSVLPNMSEVIDSPAYGEAGVRNCSLIAQFVLTFFKRGDLNYTKLLMDNTSKQESVKKASDFNLKSYAKGDSTALLCEFGDHNAAIVCEGNLYGLYQADDGVFHVFPKLNDDGESHHIFGSGDDTVSLINKEVDRLQAKYTAIKVTAVP
jgi:hypothetical protein